MNRNFKIGFRHSAGNLHISLFGEFSGMCAWELIKTIKRRCVDSGRIFVDARGLRGVTRGGTHLFRTHMTRKRLPPDWLYFKGKKGFDIAPNGSRVIICRKKDDQNDKPRPRFKVLTLPKEP